MGKKTTTKKNMSDSQKPQQDVLNDKHQKMSHKKTKWRRHSSPEGPPGIFIKKKRKKNTQKKTLALSVISLQSLTGQRLPVKA